MVEIVKIRMIKIDLLRSQGFGRESDQTQRLWGDIFAWNCRKGCEDRCGYSFLKEVQGVCTSLP